MNTQLKESIMRKMLHVTLALAVLSLGCADANAGLFSLLFGKKSTCKKVVVKPCKKQAAAKSDCKGSKKDAKGGGLSKSAADAPEAGKKKQPYEEAPPAPKKPAAKKAAPKKEAAPKAAEKK